jgi:hypothetical protein
MAIQGFSPTFVVDSASKLSLWANNTAGYDYTYVRVTAGNYTLSGKGINLTETATRQVEGSYDANGNATSIITLTNLPLSATPFENIYNKGMFYGVQPASDNYIIDGIKLVMSGVIGSSSIKKGTTIYGFFNCRNVYGDVEITAGTGYAGSGSSDSGGEGGDGY